MALVVGLFASPPPEVTAQDEQDHMFKLSSEQVTDDVTTGASISIPEVVDHTTQTGVTASRETWASPDRRFGPVPNGEVRNAANSSDLSNDWIFLGDNAVITAFDYSAHYIGDAGS
jgi:hypothetical protein